MFSGRRRGQARPSHIRHVAESCNYANNPSAPHQLIYLDIDFFGGIEMFQGVPAPPADTLHDFVIVTGKTLGAAFSEFLKDRKLIVRKDLLGRVNGCG